MKYYLLNDNINKDYLIPKTMNETAMTYYVSKVCMKPIDPHDVTGQYQLCCQEKEHDGVCDAKPRLHLLDAEHYPDRFILEAAICQFLSSIGTSIDSNKIMACISFDFVCFATMLADAKRFINWSEQFDMLRKSVFCHVMRVNSQMKKLDLRLFNEDKMLICPILGKKISVSLFVKTLASLSLTKTNILPYSQERSISDYSGPFIIPISERGQQIVGDYSLAHNPYSSDNWRHELKTILEFQNSI